MIDIIRTARELQIDIEALSKNSVKKVWWTCAQCAAGALKSYRDCLKSSGLCAKCHRLKRGYALGHQFGKAQKVKGTCLYCTLSIPSQHKTCAAHRAGHLSTIRSGSNNPAWTGKQVCACGSKKSHGATQCRPCSFLLGKRSGKNNGRFIVENRVEYLNLLKASKITRGLLGNLLVSLGKKKRNSTELLLRYTFSDLKTHLETQFTSGMIWENHGIHGWHVDHIIPVDAFIKAGIRKPHIINALWNLRPLWYVENCKKSNAIDHTTLSLLCKLRSEQLVSYRTYLKLRRSIRQLQQKDVTDNRDNAKILKMLGRGNVL